MEAADTLRTPLPGDFSMGELQAPVTCKFTMHDSHYELSASVRKE